MINPFRRTCFQLAPRAAVAAIVLMLSPSGYGALSQTAATKIIVPAPAGGALDVFTRILADEISRKHARTIVIENRPGGGSVIGIDMVLASFGGCEVALSLPPRTGRRTGMLP